jgi:hypothetical protein
MRAALTTLLLVTLAACGSGAEAPEDAATYEPHGEGGNAALLEGTLTHEGDCFYVDTTEGERFLPIFPSDSVETSGSTLTYADTAFEPGEGIALGGGETPRTADIAEAANVPSGCDQDVALWVVSQTG